MTRQIALILYLLGISALFYLDRDRKSRISFALWLPVIWVFLGASRAVSMWIGSATPMRSPDQYLDGSPIDRAVYTFLIAAAIVVLATRGPRTLAFLRANPFIVVFLLYCALSASWSDFPLVAFKRWTKAAGNVIMILIVLTEADPLAAIKRLFVRTGFWLVPISVLFIKYYPELGRGFSVGWKSYYSGVANEKNGLGAICLIWGLVSIWRFMEAYRDKNHPARGRILVTHAVMLGLMVWLLNMADSSTSLLCLVLGSVILIVSPRLSHKGPRAIHTFVATLACVAVVTYIFQDAWSSVVHSLGRETDLTGRTELWKELLQYDLNPFLGSGFESFWLGERAHHFWDEYSWHPNQAHNGYLETYLNLGWIGVFLLSLLIGTAYRNVVRMFRKNTSYAPLLLSFVIITIIYNMTEAAFKVTQPVYISFLLALIARPAILFQSQKRPVIYLGHMPARMADDEASAIQRA